MLALTKQLLVGYELLRYGSSLDQLMGKKFDDLQHRDDNDIYFEFATRSSLTNVDGEYKR